MKKYIVTFFIFISLSVFTQTAMQSGESSPDYIPNVTQEKEQEKEISSEIGANEEYVKAFKYGTPSQKLSTISRIKIGRSDLDIALLAEFYPKESNPKVKMEILNLFKQVKNENAKRIIDYALDDKDGSVRKEAYSLCAIYPDARFESKLMNDITNQKGIVLDSMINALGSMKSLNAADYLLEIYTNAASGTKVEILRYFSETKDSKGEALAKEAAQNTADSIFVRYMGIVSLGSYPSLENYEILQNIMLEDKPELTARVIYVLPSFNSYGDVKKDVVEAAKNDSDSVRLYAIKALKDYRNDTDVRDLLLYRLKTDGLESVTLEILDIYKDSPSGDILEAIKALSESFANKKIQSKAKEIIDGLAS